MRGTVMCVVASCPLANAPLSRSAGERSGERAMRSGVVAPGDEEERDRDGEDDGGVDAEVDHPAGELLVCHGLLSAQRRLRADGEDAPGGGDGADEEEGA